MDKPKLTPSQAKIIEAIKAGHVTPADMAKYIKMSREDVSRVLRWLHHRERVERIGRGVYRTSIDKYVIGKEYIKSGRYASSQDDGSTDRLVIAIESVPLEIRKRILELDEEGLYRGDIKRKTGVSRLLIGLILEKERRRE